MKTALPDINYIKHIRYINHISYINHIKMCLMLFMLFMCLMSVSFQLTAQTSGQTAGQVAVKAAQTGQAAQAVGQTAGQISVTAAEQAAVKAAQATALPGSYSYRRAVAVEKGNDSVPGDQQQALLLYQAAADSLYAPALNYLGFRYYSGQGVKRDVNRALDMIEKAAQGDDPTAASNLAWLLTEGEGVRHDCEKALFWLDRAVKGGSPAALSQLADFYLKGECLQADTTRAAELYEQSRMAGYAPAAKPLAEIIRSRRESLSPDSLFNLGRHFYFSGSPEIGVELLETACDSLSPERKGIAQMILSDAHARAYGTFYDYRLANRLLVEAAFAGDPTAAFFLAEQLEIFPDFLEDFPQNAATAAEWYSAAASKGISDSRSAYRRLRE